MFVPAVEGHLDSVMEQVKERPFDEVVREWADGPARLSPVRIVDRWLNAAEHFVHHEDVRRGQWMVDRRLVEPRHMTDAEEAALTRSVVVVTKMMLRHSQCPVQIRIPGRITLDIHPRSADGRCPVTVTGAPGEVLLWIYGRDAVHLDIEPPNGPDPRTLRP